MVKGKLREQDPVPRDIPITLPEHLLLHLFDTLELEVPEDAIKRYWNHAKAHNCPWYHASPEANHVPLSLYGDSAKYSASGQKITCCFISIPLWNPRSARMSKWLLFSLETEFCLGALTLNPLYARIVASMIKLYTEGLKIRGKTMKFVMSELKGDWEWHCYSMSLTRTWRHPQFCWRCEASKTSFQESYLDFREAPTWIGTQLTQPQFLVRCINGHQPGGPSAVDAWWNTWVHDSFSMFIGR